MAEHIVIYGEGDQALRFTPIDRTGRPTRIASATFSIVDLRYSTTSDDRLIASGAASVDDASSTLTGDAGPQSFFTKRIPVADASQFTAGRTYLLAKADGQRETVQVARVDTAANFVEGAFPLRGSYTTGDTLQGIELSATFPSSEADSEDETVKDPGHPGYQIVWSFTIDDREHVVGELVRVSRYSLQPWITAEDVIRAYPAAATRAPDYVESAIVCACEDIQAELEAGGHDPSLVRMGNTGKVMTRYLALHYVLSWMHGDDDREDADRFFARYKDMAVQVFGGGRTPRDVSSLDQATDEPSYDVFDGLFVRG